MSERLAPTARRTPISRHDLMERLECSQATLYRLVAELRDFLGAPLEQDPETRGFYYDRSYQQPFELPGIWISPQELQALLTARQVLGNVQPGLLEGELETLRGRGYDLRSSCESGTCGTCITRYLSGEPDHRDFVLHEDGRATHIMICVSRARSDELVLDL